MLKLLSTLLFLTLSLCAMAQTSLNQRVLFAPDSVNIRESQDAQIEIVAEYMHKHPQATVIVAGFVSNLTTPSKAEEVAQQRADAVMRRLISRHSIPSSRLMAIGVGEGKRYDQPEFNEFVSFFVK
jgi:outer membrane protein OmpA-like peptidoglycan-associated protein